MNSTSTISRAVQAIRFEFGPFSFDPVRRELRDASGPVRIGSRSQVLLEVLLESPGRLYSREELVQRVWPRTVVEETSLRVHISALRRLLGDGQAGARYIANVPGRGYAFVDEVRVITQDSPPGAEDPARESIQLRRGLPAHLPRPIGRGCEIARIGELLSRERMVSIVGAGGIGKTTVALAVAEHQKPLHERGVIFVDLSKLTDPALVVADVAQACGLDVSRGTTLSTQELENALCDQQAVIILDNCEHVIDAAAGLVVRLMRSCPQLRLLATSREPLEVESEWVFRLPPLGLPEPGTPSDVEALLECPAVQLFVERARAACDQFELTIDNAADVRQLCEFLDGIPLAIELAAARVNSMGVSGILLRLENAVDLLTYGRRTADSRHRTLHAVMNWSYQLLTEAERRVLHRLSVFRGGFDLDAAVAVAACPELPHASVIDGVLSLCQKSLVIRTSDEDSIQRYRLHHITRLFAERQLAAEDPAADVSRRHAGFMLSLVARRGEDALDRSHSRRAMARASLIPDLCAAVKWALVEENDMVLGLEIMAESMSHYFAADLMHEARRQLLVALDKVKRAGVEYSSLEFKLRKNLTFMLGQIQIGKEELDAHMARTRCLARTHGSDLDQIETLYGLAACSYGNGNYLQALAYCDEVREIAQAEHAPLSIAIGDRLAALCLHALGQHEAAERLAHCVLLADMNAVPLQFQSVVPYAVSMGIRLARIHWLRGDFQRAWVAVQEALDGAVEAHTQAKCQVLALAAIPIALWKGERGIAGRWKQELQQHATRANLAYWRTFAAMYGFVLDSPGLDRADDAEQTIGSNAPVMDMFAAVHSNRVSALTVARVRNGEAGWCAPEILRRAALARLDDSVDPDRTACARSLHQAFDLSVEQGARFWSLRIALSLHDIAEPGGPEQQSARSAVLALLNAVDDGSKQPDLQRARQLVRGSR